ncbi:MAG TPA: TlpA disulfide reductase family protein [Woeseiaceae bacterium]|nr:TlpA disulfide reductase family protein [Woeseiaceae bacterium]
MILQRNRLKRLYLSSLVVLCGQAAAAAGPLPDGALDLDDYRGQVVLVHFWASWSAPCRRSFPWLAAMHDRYAGQGLVIVAVNEDDAATAARAFLEEFPVSFTRIRDANGELFDAWDIVAMPSSYVIDRGGQVVARYLGFKPAQVAELEATVRGALAGKPERAGAYTSR